MHTYANGRPAQKGDKIIIRALGAVKTCVVTDVLNVREGVEDLRVAPIDQTIDISASNAVLVEDVFAEPIQPKA